MRHANFSALLKSAGRWAKDKSPQILVAVGITGMVGTVIAAVKVTPKAKELIEQAEEEKGDKLTPVETVKTTWKCYAIPAATFVASTACIVGASAQNAKRNAALVTACSLSETALKTYQEKVVETLGEAEEKKVRKKAQEEIAEKHPEMNNLCVLGGQEVLCVDPFGNEFPADPEDIRHAVNVLNDRLITDDCSSLNEWYYDIPKANPTKVGDYIGWNRERDGLVNLYFGSDLGANQKPRLVIELKPLPKYEYNLYR